MKKAIILLNHPISAIQQEELTSIFGVEELVLLPKELQKLWSQVPPNIDSLDEWLEPFKKFLRNELKEEDVVVVQGEFGATYATIRYVQTLSAIAVYATSTRKSTADESGQKISLFKHERFRVYK